MGFGLIAGTLAQIRFNCMKYISIFVVVGLCAILPHSFVSNTRRDRSPQLPSADVANSGGCLTEQETMSVFRRFSLGYGESERAQALLIKNSKVSPRCRTLILTRLVDAMSKNVKIDRDLNSDYLWKYGADVLGELRAVEALDLLATNLDLDDGLWSSSMAHRPALNGMIKMGSIAIPKLSSVLGQSPNRKTRLAAVYCIASIGGPSALLALKNALPKESDQCVSRFIRISIDAFRNRKLPNQVTSRDRTKWSLAFMCNG